MKDSNGRWGGGGGVDSEQHRFIRKTGVRNN